MIVNQQVRTHHSRLRSSFFFAFVFKPTVVAAPPGGAAAVQPIFKAKVRAKISPKPSMTPLTKGRRRLIASEETRASTRARVDKRASNTDIVAEGGVPDFAAAAPKASDSDTLTLSACFPFSRDCCFSDLSVLMSPGDDFGDVLSDCDGNDIEG